MEVARSWFKTKHRDRENAARVRPAALSVGWRVARTKWLLVADFQARGLAAPRLTEMGPEA